MPKHISGQEYQHEHNQGQKDVAAGTSNSAARALTAFFCGKGYSERYEAYMAGRKSAERDIERNREEHRTDRREEAEESRGSESFGSYSGGSSDNLGLGGAIIGGVAAICIGLVAGALWLVYAFFRSIIMGCVKFYRHYKSLDIVRKIEHRRGMIALFILALVILPLPTMAIYNSLSHYIYQRYIVDKSTLIIRMNDGWVISCWRNGDENYQGRCVIGKDNINITLREGKQIAPRIYLSSRQTSYGWYDYQKDTLQIDGVPVARHEGDDSDVIKRMLRGKTAKMFLIKETDPVHPYSKEAPNSIVAITKLDNLANVYAKMEETFRERYKIKLPDNKTWLQ